MIPTQVHDWPRLIGGPLHGSPIPNTTDRTLIGYIEGPQEGQKFYHDVKFRFGNIAMRVLIYEGPLDERRGEFLQDVAIHALATVGITVEE